MLHTPSLSGFFAAEGNLKGSPSGSGTRGGEDCDTGKERRVRRVRRTEPANCACVRTFVLSFLGPASCATRLTARGAVPGGAEQRWCRRGGAALQWRQRWGMPQAAGMTAR